jgi:predicted amidohydrolase YtcJ
VTHEYVLATGGVIYGAQVGTRRPTAVAWAADRILVVGSDDEVRAISRGDSHTFELAGRAVTALPAEPREAELRLRRAIRRGLPFEPDEVLRPLLAPGADARLSVGGRADLAIWSRDPRALTADGCADLRIEHVVRGGRMAESPTATGPLADPPG